MGSFILQTITYSLYILIVCIVHIDMGGTSGLKGRQGLVTNIPNKFEISAFKFVISPRRTFDVLCHEIR